MDNLAILVVDMSTMWVYDYLSTGETPEDLLKRAKTSQKQDISTWESHCRNYPDNPTFEEYLAKAKKLFYRVMTHEEFLTAERDFYINRPMEEITAERFNEMLNILPPICWTTIQGVEMFCMSEMLTGTYTDQYARVGDKYFNKIVDIKDRATWIHNFIGATGA